MRHALFALAITLLPWQAHGYSDVFTGDPVNTSTGIPHEILPGFPLVEAGPDTILGTLDDVITPEMVGDIDVVVRSGSPAAAATLPPPQIQSGRSTVPVGVAGSGAAGGTTIPFTVFLSDGTVEAGAPSGHLLATTDMDDVPVVVAAFADYDGDGYIGPIDTDMSNTTDNHHEVRELDPVGRAVALFSAGVARGEIAVRAGLPASHGGLSVLLTALALSGPFDPGFFEGEVPSGPALSTALPFVPQRDLARLFRDRAVLVSPDTSLQPVIRFAALPSSTAPAPFALPLDGSSPTVDVAVVHSQPAVKAALFEADEPLGVRQHVDTVVFGTRGTSTKRSYRLMPTDRFGNPADPGVGFVAALRGLSPFKVVRPRSGVILENTDGIVAKMKLNARTADGSSGSFFIEAGGVVVDAPRYSVDARLNRLRADITVPSVEAATIQAAIGAVYDKRRDGLLVIDVAAGLYRETIALDRGVVLRGAGRGLTIIQGNGSGSALHVSANGSSLRGLTVSGGATGITIGAADVEMLDVGVWRNVGAGVAVSAGGARLARVDGIDNGGDGVTVGGGDVAIDDATLLDNLGYGIAINAASGGSISRSLLIGNALSGIALLSADDSTVTANRLANNLDIGIELESANGNHVVGNLCALSDGDGLKMDETDGNFVSANILDGNNGYGLYVRRSTNADFAALAGVQSPIGDNVAQNNRKGDVFVRED